MTLAFNFLAVAAAGLTGALYVYGLEESLFWRYPWYDILLHLLGGLAVGLWGVALASHRSFSLRKTLILVLGLVIVVGIVWEVFESIAGLTKEVGYWFDTFKDLANDIIGALVGVLLYGVFYKSKKQDHV